MTPMDRRALVKSLMAGGAGLALFGRLPDLGATGAAPLAPAGTRPDPSLPEGTDLIPQIDHLIVLVMENRSFDHYFGLLGRGDGLAVDGSGVPVATNPDSGGNPVRMHEAPAGIFGSVSNGYNSSYAQMNGGAMDGFVTASGVDAMTYLPPGRIPFYWSLGSTFPLCDRFFCSVPGPTFPNRRYMSAGTSAGLTSTSVQSVLASPVAPNGNIYERLDALGVSWQNYTVELPEVALWPDYFFASSDTTSPITDFYRACRAGTLPSFSLVSPGLGVDEHPPQDPTGGEQFAGGVIREVLNSPVWDRCLMVWTYDEHGGFYDHVPPPPAVDPGDGTTDPSGLGFSQCGPRVPGVVLSPFAKSGYVSPIVHDHASILRMIETKWNIGALTARDANASNLLDSLDLTAPPAFVNPPDLAAPARGWPDIDAQLATDPEPPSDRLLTHDDVGDGPVAGSPTFTG